jgi:hypothetical protein
MMRSLRSLFLARLLREKILLVAFVLVIDVLWLSSLAGRAGHFMAAERHTTSALAEQTRWLANRAAVDKAAQTAARAFQPEQTLDSTRLLAAIQDIANNCGLHNFNTAPPEDVPSTGLATVHTLQFTVNKVHYDSLETFCSALQRRAPYIGVEQFTVIADKANPEQLSATMKISSVEILR